jgi:hypothetical protein
MVYDLVRLQPTIFKDDICRLVRTLQEAQAGNIKLDMIMKSKQLYNVYAS